MDDSSLKDLGVDLVGDDEDDEDAVAEPAFRLSDLVADYSTDSGPQSEPRTDDEENNEDDDDDNSRPMSRLGSSNSRIAYIDRSGGATSEDLLERNDELTIDTPELSEENKGEFRPKSMMTRMLTPDEFLKDVNEARPEKIDEESPKQRKRYSDDCLLSRRYVLILFFFLLFIANRFLIN